MSRSRLIMDLNNRNALMEDMGSGREAPSFHGHPYVTGVDYSRSSRAIADETAVCKT